MRGINQLQSNEIPQLRARVYRLEEALVHTLGALYELYDLASENKIVSQELHQQIGSHLSKIQDTIAESDVTEESCDEILS